MTTISGRSPTLPTRHRMTLEEYLTYDDGTETRYELVDGVLVEMGAESRSNIKIALFLIKVFLRFVEYDRLGIKEKIEVTSDFVTARDPDLIVHSEASAIALEGAKESCLKLSDPNPLIVIEIASPGTESSDNYQRDYVQKPQEYAARGIPEYWIIDPERSIAKIGTLVNDTYQFQDFTGDQAIASAQFPDFTVTVAQLLHIGE